MSDNGIERETENKAAGVGREDNYEDDEVNAPGAGEDDGIERGNANDDVVAAEDERRGGRGDNYKDDEDNASGAGEDDGIERGNADADVDAADDERRGVVENEAAGDGIKLRDEELDEFMKIYYDIAMKGSESDGSTKEFYGLLQKCLETKMTNTRQWNARKDLLTKSMRQFEDAVKVMRRLEDEVKDEAAISQRTENGLAWYRAGIIPAIIENAKKTLLGADDERRGEDDEDNASGVGEDDGIERGNADADVDAEDIGRGEHENEAANLDDDSSFEEFMEAYHNPEVRERRERRLQRIADQELEQRRAEREEQRRVEREELRAQMERLEEQENRRRALDLDHWDEDVLNRVVNEFETIRPRLAGRAVLLIHQLEPSPLLFDPDVVVERTLHTIAFTDAVDYGLLSNHLSWENGFPLINFYRTGWMTEVYNIPDDDDFARDMLDAVQPETDLDIYAFNVFLDKMDVARNGLWRDE